ncbi:DNA repair protein rad50 [Massospora cicadina]|nr:DNA repair protein rad50 [Massospora cicadina]
MASIEKLLIRGLRSFDPDDPSVIKFYKPLTLIVGPNGAGKTEVKVPLGKPIRFGGRRFQIGSHEGLYLGLPSTLNSMGTLPTLHVPASLTIIEALKYATTGESPPNTKGSAFIHDPRILGRTEVTSEVRLQFYSVNGVAMESHRSAQVLQRKATATFKTLQSVLQSYDAGTGEKTSATLRSADLDEEVARNLGVTKAILDNVIFCHQEESNWPLSDSSTLKKRFDEIFASTHYSKMSDNLRKMLKAEMAVLNEHRTHLAIKERDRNASQKLKLQNRELEELVLKYKDQVEPLTAKLDELSLTITRLAILEREATNYTREVDKIRQNFREIQAPGETLERMRVEKEAQIGSAKEQKARADLLHEQLNEELMSIQDMKCSLLSQQGKLKSDAETYEQTYQEIRELLLEIRPQLPGAATEASLIGEISEETITELHQLLETQIAYDRKEAEDAKERSRAKQKEVTELLQELRIQEHQCQLILASSASKKVLQPLAPITFQEECTRKLNEARNRLELHRSELSGIEALRHQLQEKERELESAKLQLVDADIDGKITQKHHELSRAEELLSKASEELPSPTQNSTTETHITLTLKMAEHKEKSLRLRKLIEANGRQFERHLNHTPLPQSIGYQVQSTLAVKKEEIKATSRQVKDRYMELAGAEAKFALLQGQVSDRQTQLIELQSQVRAACGSQDLPTVLKQSEDLLVLKESQLHLTKGMESVYSDLLEKLSDSSSRQHEPKRLKCEFRHATPERCPLCDASFLKPWDAKQLLNDLIEKQLGYQASARELTLELQRARDDAKTLRNALATWHRLDHLCNVELPSLEEEQRQYAEQAVELRREVNKAEAELQRSQLDATHLEKLIRPALEISILDNQLQQLDDEIRLLPKDATCPNSDGQPNKAAKYAAQCKQLRTDLEALRSKQGAMHKHIKGLEDAVHAAREKVADVGSQGQMVLQLTSLIMSLEEELSRAETSAASKAAQLKELTPQIAIKQQEIELAISIGDELITQHHASLNRFTQYRDKLRAKRDAIRQLESADTHAKLNQMNMAIQRHDANISQTRAQLQQTNELIKTLDAQIKSNLSDIDNLLQNLHHLKVSAQLAAVKREHADLKQSCEDTTYEKLQAELIQKRKDQNLIIAKRAGLLGEIKVLETQLQRNRNELDINYKGIEEAYRTTAHRVATGELKTEDLEVYTAALEKAIMKYHSIKMAEINKIIQELWAATYFGSDIDTVRIKSDIEKQTSRSFNYRVVMVKGGIELDMRGRCSAGQKVLASIIVRLALAEAFGANCGILALDEPTTNLDRDNIQSLARSLVSLIRSRRNQHNFQLLVITHDEEFTADLGRSDHTDYYWVVAKDNGQTSRIRRKDIKDLF